MSSDHLQQLIAAGEPDVVVIGGAASPAAASSSYYDTAQPIKGYAHNGNVRIYYEVHGGGRWGEWTLRTLWGTWS